MIKKIINKYIFTLVKLKAMEEFYLIVKFEGILPNARQLLANDNQYTRSIQCFVKITLVHHEVINVEVK
jgi:hypothetical protein